MSDSRAVLPSGRQFEIALGDQRAVVVEVGGGLRAYVAGGADVWTATRTRPCAHPGAVRC